MTERELRRIFASERRRFSKAFAHVGKTRLYIAHRACSMPNHCRFRDMAYAMRWDHSASVTVLERVRFLPRTNVIGIFRHELGHVADPRLGARGAEQRADDIAEIVTGDRINYDELDVQTIGRGKYPRPKRLHR